MRSRFKDKWDCDGQEDWLFSLDREALPGTKVIKLKWRRLRSLPLSYVRAFSGILRSSVDDDHSLASHRSSIVHLNRPL